MREEAESLTSGRRIEDVHAPATRGAIDRQSLMEALAAILESAPFRGSKQCRDLLSYIVEHSLLAEDGALRERMIGVAVFGRASDYSTGEDPVVRMRAADVRKRLAQYYQSVDLGGAVPQIDLQPGSYRASFRMSVERKESAETLPALLSPASSLPGALAPLEEPGVLFPLVAEPRPHRRVGLWIAWAVVGAVLVLAYLGGYRWFSGRAGPLSAQQQFWAPMLKDDKPVLIYLGSNVAYVFSPEFMDRYEQANHISKENGPEFLVNLPPRATVHGSDLLPVGHSFVTVGDLAATTQVVSLLNGFRKRFVLRSAADVSFGDLRNTPTVLVGGFNNQWTLEMTKELPFRLKDGTRIEDRDHPGRSWTTTGTSGSPNYEDFAIVSRLVRSTTGAPSIVVAGVGQSGTQAAAELLADPERLNEVLKRAPAGWDTKNLQLVLRVKAVDYLPGSVDVVASSFW